MTIHLSQFILKSTFRDRTLPHCLSRIITLDFGNMWEYFLNHKKPVKYCLQWSDNLEISKLEYIPHYAVLGHIYGTLNIQKLCARKYGACENALGLSLQQPYEESSTMLP